jgi:metal-sulfur cluster biosynthetic enzyme
MFRVVDDGREPNESSTRSASLRAQISGLSRSESGPRRSARIRRMPTVDEVNDALSNVIDPELGLDFVELGLVYDVEIDAATVNITFTLTTPACPIGPQVSEQMVEFVGELDGVEQVNPRMVFSPPWSPERMSEDAKFALGF